MKGRLPALIVNVVNGESLALSVGQNMTNLVKYSNVIHPETLDESTDIGALMVESIV